MILSYIAGRFSAPTRELVEANIAAAEGLGLFLASRGYYPVIPHSSTGHPGFEHIGSYEFYIEGTLELMRRCDCVVLVPGWESSRGARGEVEEAERLGIPVFPEQGNALIARLDRLKQYLSLFREKGLRNAR